MQNYKDWLENLFEIAPDAVVASEEDGQLVVYTGLIMDQPATDASPAPVEECFVYRAPSLDMYDAELV